MEDLGKELIGTKKNCATLTEKLEHKRKKHLERSHRSQEKLHSMKYDYVRHVP